MDILEFIALIGLLIKVFKLGYDSSHKDTKK